MVNRALAIRDDMDLMTLGRVLAESGFFQDSRGASQAIVKVLAGRELGFGPIASMTGINVIKGRVSISANLMAAKVKNSGRYNYKIKRLDARGCTIEFFENGQLVGESSFNDEDAKTAGLAGGDNYKKHPRNMYFARAMSNGAKWYCPDVFSTPIYTPDELGAEIDGETGEVINLPTEPATVIDEWDLGQDGFFEKAKHELGVVPSVAGYVLQESGVINGDKIFDLSRIKEYWQVVSTMGVDCQRFIGKVMAQNPFYSSAKQILDFLRSNEWTYDIENEEFLAEELARYAHSGADKELDKAEIPF